MPPIGYRSPQYTNKKTMKISQNLEEGSLKIENGVNRIKIECGWYKLFISTQHKDEEEKLITEIYKEDAQEIVDYLNNLIPHIKSKFQS